jgi:plasmid stabilization system protein ParE
MTRLLFTGRALRDIERVTAFLMDTLPQEALETATLISQGVGLLRDHPEVGRPIGRGLRELVISRGRTGYLALYRFDADADVVSILALRHQREAGYA